MTGTVMACFGRQLTVLFALAVVAVAAAPYYHRSRPPLRCGIPLRDYQYRDFSPPQRSLSSEPLLLSTATAGDAAGALAAAGGARPTALGAPEASAYGSRRTIDTGAPEASAYGSRQTIKSFQFVEQAVLQIDHCYVHRMSVLLHESGHWSVSLRAEQNPRTPPRPAPLDATTSEEARRFTSHLERNQFHIDVRCYAGHGQAATDSLLGKPLVVPLPVAPFWVQKEQPRQLYETGFDPRIRDYFALLDRAEIEFRYRVE